MVGVDRGRVGGPRGEDVVEHRFRVGAQQPLGHRRGLGQQAPRPVPERWPAAHALELVDRRDDVQHREPVDALRVVERHPVADPRATVVTDDREALVSEARHDLHQLGGHLPLRVALAARASGRRCRAPYPRMSGATTVGDGQRTADAVPAPVRLREAVQEEHRIAGAPFGQRIPGVADLEAPLVHPASGCTWDVISPSMSRWTTKPGGSAVSRISPGSRSSPVCT